MNTNTAALLITAVTIVLLVMIAANTAPLLAFIILTAIIVLSMVTGKATQHLPELIRIIMSTLTRFR